MQGEVGGIEARLRRRGRRQRLALDRGEPLRHDFAPRRVDEEGGGEDEHAGGDAQPQPARAVRGGGRCRSGRRRLEHRLGQRRRLGHALQFALRRRAPGPPHVDIGLAEFVARQAVADPRLVRLDRQAERIGRLFDDPKVRQDLTPQPPSDSWKDED